MAVVGPRHPLKDVHEAGRVRAAGLVSSVGAFLQEHSAACAVVLAVGSVVWGLEQVS
jgi:hypothetical protein